MTFFRKTLAYFTNFQVSVSISKRTSRVSDFLMKSRSRSFGLDYISAGPSPGFSSRGGQKPKRRPKTRKGATFLKYSIGYMQQLGIQTWNGGGTDFKWAVGHHWPPRWRRPCISGRYSASIERMCWCTSKACKYKKRKNNVGHDDFLIKWNIGCKKHTAYRTLLASRLSQALLQESFTSK